MKVNKIVFLPLNFLIFYYKKCVYCFGMICLSTVTVTISNFKISSVWGIKCLYFCWKFLYFFVEKTQCWGEISQMLFKNCLSVVLNNACFICRLFFWCCLVHIAFFIIYSRLQLFLSFLVWGVVALSFIYLKWNCFLPYLLNMKLLYPLFTFPFWVWVRFYE